MLGNCSEDSQKPRVLHLVKFHRLTPQFADTDARVRRKKIDQVRLLNLLAAFFRMRKETYQVWPNSVPPPQLPAPWDQVDVHVRRTWHRGRLSERRPGLRSAYTLGSHHGILAGALGRTSWPEAARLSCCSLHLQYPFRPIGHPRSFVRPIPCLARKHPYR